MFHAERHFISDDPLLVQFLAVSSLLKINSLENGLNANARCFSRVTYECLKNTQDDDGKIFSRVIVTWQLITCLSECDILIF